MIVQAIIVLVLYRSVRKTQEKIEPLVERAAPVIDKVGPVIDRIHPIIEKLGPVIEKVGPAVDNLRATTGKAGVAIEQVGPLIQKVTPVVEHAAELLASAKEIVADARPRVAEIASDVAAITHSGKEQVEHIGELVHTAGEKARERLDQIDHAVSDTVEHVEHAGASMKRAVLRPVREVNGLAAGVSAAVSSLVKGRRKSSVDSATQDEELFI